MRLFIVRSVTSALLATVFFASVTRADDAPPLPPPQPVPVPAPVPVPTPVATTSITTTSVTTTAPAAPDTGPPKDTDTDKTKRLADETFLHGFRLGYAYVMNYDKPVDSLSDGNGPQSLKDKVGMRTPSQFLIGYEFIYRAVGHSWLNVILVANGTIAGLEQSKFYPTANGLIGFEFNNSFQVGVGPSLSPLKGQEAHVIVAAGWTPRVGSFYVPVHAFFIPDVDGYNRIGMTTQT